MSGTVNRVTLIGRLGKDPETKTVGDDKKVCKFSLATDESWTQGGEKKQKTQWHNIVAWAKLGETCQKYLKKGSLIFLEGKIEYRKWEGDDGQEKKATDIIMSSLTMLGNKEENTGSGGTSEKKVDDWGKGSSKKATNQDADEDIPF